jgi:hypothetical protein
MVGMTDVAAIRGNPAGEITHQTRTVRTDQLKDDRGSAQREAWKSRFSRANRAG